MRSRTFLMIATVLPTLALARPAAAGGEVLAGGGVVDFTSASMRDATSPGGLWNVRAAWQPRWAIAVEAGYTGSAQSVDAPLSGAKATLIGTTAEVAVRGNFLAGDWQPYLVIGGGYTRYQATRSFTTADAGMNAGDSLFEIPAGIGLSYRDRGYVFDVRATMRMTSGESLMPVGQGLYATMDTWAATFVVGHAL